MARVRAHASSLRVRRCVDITLCERDHAASSQTAAVHVCCRSCSLSSRTGLTRRVTCTVLLRCCSFRFPDLFPDTAGVELMQKKLNALIQDGVVGLARLKKNEPSVVDPARASAKLASSPSQDDDQLTDRERRQAAEKILSEQKDNVVFENNGNGGGGGGGGGGENSEMTADVRLESRCV